MSVGGISSGDISLYVIVRLLARAVKCRDQETPGLGVA
jgi:hypothetical protein